ncbi:unnamed protein product [Trichogramma brassicae]|uniref:Uncharacterized protein n=1 Tax=Trichogramma brassicae TaxID=86971 RepID=A0A6H5ISI4_9HYME|nr:unnamed protein product [Trichogramma brassicae]
MIKKNMEMVTWSKFDTHLFKKGLQEGQSPCGVPPSLLSAQARGPVGQGKPGEKRTGKCSISCVHFSSNCLTSRRIVEWEPGKVRRRVAQSRETDSTSSLPRSRSNSHSGGCSTTNSTVPPSRTRVLVPKRHRKIAPRLLPLDHRVPAVGPSSMKLKTSSGICSMLFTEKASGLEKRSRVCKVSYTNLNPIQIIKFNRIFCRNQNCTNKSRLESVAPEDLDDVPSDILDAVRNVTDHTTRQGKRLDHSDLDENFLDDDNDNNSDELALLRREKLQLLDKVAELEAETIAGRARTQELQSQLAALALLKTGLEDRLKIGLSAAGDISSEILTPAPNRLTPIDAVSTNGMPSPRGSNGALNIGGKGSAFASVVTSTGSESKLSAKSRFRTRTIKKNVLQRAANQMSTTNRSYEDIYSAVASQDSSAERRARLGALDSVLVSPTRMPLRRLPRADVDTLKIAAILKEKEPLELQRHLITTTVHNQLAERNIELEGTRARVRVLERLQQRPATETDADDESELALHQLSNGTLDTTNSNSSAESSREPLVNLQNGAALKPSPRRRPSRIPLPGASKAAAPKPPIIQRSRCTYDSASQNYSRDALGKQQQTSNGSPSSSANSNRLKSNRDSSRESLNKSISLNKSQTNKSLSRSIGSSNNNNSGNDNYNKNSLGKATNSNSLTKPKDSLESNSGGAQAPPSTPPRRPSAPTRRSQSQAPISSRSVVNAAASADQDYGGKLQPPLYKVCDLENHSTVLYKNYLSVLSFYDKKSFSKMWDSTAGSKNSPTNNDLSLSRDPVQSKVCCSHQLCACERERRKDVAVARESERRETRTKQCIFAAAATQRNEDNSSAVHRASTCACDRWQQLWKRVGVSGGSAAISGKVRLASARSCVVASWALEVVRAANAAAHASSLDALCLQMSSETFLLPAESDDESARAAACPRRAKLACARLRGCPSRRSVTRRSSRCFTHTTTRDRAYA